jgi:hypothetical protein
VTRESNLQFRHTPSRQQLQHFVLCVGVVSPTGWSAPMTQNIDADLNIN